MQNCNINHVYINNDILLWGTPTTLKLAQQSSTSGVDYWPRIDRTALIWCQFQTLRLHSEDDQTLNLTLTAISIFCSLKSNPGLKVETQFRLQNHDRRSNSIVHLKRKWRELKNLASITTVWSESGPPLIANWASEIRMVRTTAHLSFSLPQALCKPRIQCISSNDLGFSIPDFMMHPVLWVTDEWVLRVFAL